MSDLETLWNMGSRYSHLPFPFRRVAEALQELLLASSERTSAEFTYGLPVMRGSEKAIVNKLEAGQRFARAESEARLALAALETPDE